MTDEVSLLCTRAKYGLIQWKEATSNVMQATMDGPIEQADKTYLISPHSAAARLSRNTRWLARFLCAVFRSLPSLNCRMHMWDG
jgi:hypothetical protein